MVANVSLEDLEAEEVHEVVATAVVVVAPVVEDTEVVAPPEDMVEAAEEAPEVEAAVVEATVAEVVIKMEVEVAAVAKIGITEVSF